MDKLREVILENLPKGFEEQLCYNMPSYVVPHSLYPAGYHCNPKLPLNFMALVSQKGAISMHHMGLYGSPELLEWFTAEHAKAGVGKLDMGKGCVRFKKPEQIPFELIGKLAAKLTPQEWIALYEKAFRKK